MEDTFSECSAPSETEEANDDSDLFSQIDDMKDIELKDFSSIIRCQSEHVYFIRKENFTGPLYAVHVYPDGISSENEGYVSVQVSKVLKDVDVISEVGYDSITWTFSVVDVDGCGRYFQSVTKDNIADLPYQIVIPKFLKRSFVLERSDELLPGDVLTIRCEATFVYYSVDALHDELVIDLCNVDAELATEDERVFDLEKNLKFNEFSESDNNDEFEKCKENANHIPPSESNLVSFRRVVDTVEDMTYYILIMLGFLNEYHECKQNQNLQSKDLIFQIRLLSKIVMNTDESDAIARTYMWTDPYFKVYIRLKSKVKEILNENPIKISDEEYLENEKYNCHPIYTRGSYTTFSESYSVMRKISDGIKHLKNSSSVRGNKKQLSTNEYKYLFKIVSDISESNPMWEYLYEAMRSEESVLLDSKEEQDRVDSDCSQDNGWILQIQTKDDIIFNLPFKEEEDTLGSKLITCSPVFESMLKYPMLERFSKKVVLSDIDFRTFRSFLQFLQGSSVVTDNFDELCNLYEMADKYDVKALMSDCRLIFKPFLNEENIPVVEFLAHSHSDDFLLDIIKSFKNEHSENLTKMDDGNFIVKRHLNSYMNEKKQEFDFYQ